MHWRRVAAVQEVTATIVRGVGVVEDVIAQMALKSALFDEVTVDHGANWIVLFAASVHDGNGAADAILPALDGVPLYEEAAGWWLPVGVEIAAPTHAQASLRQALAAVYALRGLAIIVPHFAEDAALTSQADLYALGARMPLSHYRLAAA
ncbi:hypothetical protein [Sphingomonas sp. PB4P5]|uniref:hypothetical protein n=1 Tax=Parasphingomonas puruogangriensis TaxID=3096155 RepID=UPI002FC60A0F